LNRIDNTEKKHKTDKPTNRQTDKSTNKQQHKKKKKKQMKGVPHTRIDLETSLLWLNKFLKSIGVTFVVTYGTLLGLYREQGLIEKDDGVDVWVWSKNFDQVYRAIQNRPEAVVNIVHRPDDLSIPLQQLKTKYNKGFIQFSPQKNMAPCDIYFIDQLESGNPEVTGDLFVQWDAWRIPHWEVLPFQQAVYSIQVQKIEVLQPRDPETFLSFMYGPQFRTPVSKSSSELALIANNRENRNVGMVGILARPVCVITVGCFDLLHAGHLNLLKFCQTFLKSQSCKLYIGVHDNASIKKNKNVDVAENLEVRKSKLEEALKHTATEVFEVRATDPSVFLKDRVHTARAQGLAVVYVRGNDWQDFPGKPQLQKMGVPVIFTQYTKGISSTLQRLKNVLKQPEFGSAQEMKFETKKQRQTTNSCPVE
jgi:cytidyltransferase-like protein